jgi:hypothetical protein
VPLPPLAAPMASRQAIPLLHPLLPPLSQSTPMAGHGAPTPAMTALPWRASHKLIFLRVMTKTNAHDLPLAIPTLNFIRNEL